VKTRSKATAEEKLTQAAKRALTGENLVTETPTIEPEIPQEYAAFRSLLRQVVKPEPKHVSAPVPSDKD
jgi:hypothetical protein